MTKPNYDTYNQLFDHPERLVSCVTFADWYKLTYPVFIDAPLNSMNDFWKLMAYAYSWMPTIPTVNTHAIKDENKLLTDLQAFKKGEYHLMPSLLEQLIPVVNNSLTGVSKILHFVSPDYVPIIDRNVLQAWNHFFFEQSISYNVPILPAYTTALKGRHIPVYLQYQAAILQWVKDCEGKVNLRDIESALFELGKEVERRKPKLLRVPKYMLEA